MREQITALNDLKADSPDRPAAETKLLAALQPLGIFLENATHPPLTPRVLDARDIATMERVENDIVSLDYVDRDEAAPVEVLTPDPSFTFLGLPVPLILRCEPDGVIHLAATTGGAFHNGLSLVSLQADSNGYARTFWVSYGDAVADCDITVYNAKAVEPREIRIKVVSPALPDISGLIKPENLQGEIPRLKSKAVQAKGHLESLTR